MKQHHVARAIAIIGATLFVLAHVLPLADFEDSTFFSVSGAPFSDDGASGPHHSIALAYFSYGCVLALLAVGLAAVAVFTGSRLRPALSIGALLAGAAYLTTITAQAFIGAYVPVIALGPLGAMCVAAAGFMRAEVE